jgi:hypothetical protein
VFQSCCQDAACVALDIASTCACCFFSFARWPAQVFLARLQQPGSAAAASGGPAVGGATPDVFSAFSRLLDVDGSPTQGAGHASERKRDASPACGCLGAVAARCHAVPSATADGCLQVSSGRATAFSGGSSHRSYAGYLNAAENHRPYKGASGVRPAASATHLQAAGLRGPPVGQGAAMGDETVIVGSVTCCESLGWVEQGSGQQNPGMAGGKGVCEESNQAVMYGGPNELGGTGHLWASPAQRSPGSGGVPPGGPSPDREDSCGVPLQCTGLGLGMPEAEEEQERGALAAALAAAQPQRCPADELMGARLHGQWACLGRPKKHTGATDMSSFPSKPSAHMLTCQFGSMVYLQELVTRHTVSFPHANAWKACSAGVQCVSPHLPSSGHLRTCRE